MTKDEAIEKVIDAFGFWECEYDTGDVDWSEEHEARDMAVTALATEAIPIDFIESESQRVYAMMESAVAEENFKEMHRLSTVLATLDAVISNWIYTTGEDWRAERK